MSISEQVPNYNELERQNKHRKETFDNYTGHVHTDEEKEDDDNDDNIMQYDTDNEDNAMIDLF